MRLIQRTGGSILYKLVRCLKLVKVTWHLKHWESSLSSPTLYLTLDKSLYLNFNFQLGKRLMRIATFFYSTMLCDLRKYIGNFIANSCMCVCVPSIMVISCMCCVRIRVNISYFYFQVNSYLQIDLIPLMSCEISKN